MNHEAVTNASTRNSRRQFLKTTASLAGAAAVGTNMINRAYAAGASGKLKVGLIGCGGRGTGAATQALTADSETELTAVADVFENRLNGCLSALKVSDVANRVKVAKEQQFLGFDAYKKVLETDVDVVLLATPPHFRPAHLRAAIDAGKHVFAEKPVAVDGPGVRSVLETAALAKDKGLAIVSGLCWRYEDRTQLLMKRLHEGAIGHINYAETIRYGSGVWVKPRRPEQTEMEYQMANWYYFTWLSGDFNVEQHVHELDKIAWMLGDIYPISCTATGGRQVRTGPDYGHIYDHFAGVFEYETGTKVYASTRHQAGCQGMNTVTALGTHGSVDVKARKIEGKQPYHDTEDRKIMHQREHDVMYEALRKGTIINNGEYMAKSTMMAIMQRMSAYTGKTITWEMAMNSKERLGPIEYAWDTPLEVPAVALPGKTKFI